jgi:protein O-GlcNAc transferase
VVLIDPNYKASPENLAVVLTDLGTSLKLAGNIQQGLQKYYEALKADSRYAVRPYPQIMSGIAQDLNL